MDDFDIIIKHDSKCSGDLWRVFGPCERYDDTTVFPKETKLQRAMAKYLDEHDLTTGYGYGVFLFDGKSIIR